MNSLLNNSAVALLLAGSLVWGADELLPYPLYRARSRAMGGARVAVGGHQESALSNPAFNADYRRLALTIPAAGLRLDHTFFSFLEFLEENREEFDREESSDEGRSEQFDKLLREVDTKWYGMGTDLFDAVVHFRGLSVALRNRFSVDFSVNRGLLFPFVVGNYGQVRELSVGYGRSLTDGLRVGVAAKALVQRKKKVAVASNSVGTIDSNFWKIPEESWQRTTGLDAGLLLKVFGNGELGCSVRDIGYSIEGRDRPEVTVGSLWRLRHPPPGEGGMLGSVHLAADYADALNPGPELSKVKLGVETEWNPLPWRLLQIFLRGGLDGGYPTFGVGTRILGLVFLDYTTFAEEGGAYAGQKEVRRHLIAGKITLDFNRRKKKQSEKRPSPEEEEPAEEVPSAQE